MKAQRFTVTLKPREGGKADFTVEEIEAALYRTFPNVLAEQFGTHTLKVTEVTR